MVLISQAGSEGLDFKYLRQVHIMEPWFHLSKLEQIVGRGIRSCSHKNLPFESSAPTLHDPVNPKFFLFL